MSLKVRETPSVEVRVVLERGTLPLEWQHGDHTAVTPVLEFGREQLPLLCYELAGLA